MLLPQFIRHPSLYTFYTLYTDNKTTGALFLFVRVERVDRIDAFTAIRSPPSFYTFYTLYTDITKNTLPGLNRGIKPRFRV